MKIKKIFCVLLIFSIFLFTCNNALALTNDKYGTQDVVTDITDEVVKESIVTEYISLFIFAIGNVFESVTSWIFGLLTGANSFPWADEIIFNTIDLLDINFINPSAGSLFATGTSIGVGEVIRNIYFTGISIAVGFLSIVVGVMAIRMAVSTIASEKAKYKEDIVKWLTSLVLLFGMHYGISFLFYMNEQLVIVASDILSDILDDVGDKLAEVMNSTTLEQKEQRVRNFLDDAEDDATEEIAGQVINPFFLGQNLGSLLIGSSGSDISDFEYGEYESGLRTIDNQADLVIALTNYLQSHYQVTFELLRNSTVDEQLTSRIHDRTEDDGGIPIIGWLINKGSNLINTAGNAINGWLGHNDALDVLTELYEMAVVIENPQYSSEVDILDGLDINASIQSYDTYLDAMDNLGNSDEDKLKKVVLQYAYEYKIGRLGIISGTDLIANLGQYFKDQTWIGGDEDSDKWKTTSGSVTSAILYTIFVFQSIGFFISYIRRVFMVTVLSIISPFVIIYDFFMKAAIGARNSVFNTWLRELCTLIFVQTFQAFLLAIIMSVIVSLTASEYLRNDNGISAVGILAIFALLALPKIELLLKNIFGLTSGVADTSLAAGQRTSFAGGLLALGAARRLVDNPLKVLGGAKKAIGGQLRLRQAKNDKYDKEISDRNDGDEALLDGSGAPLGPRPGGGTGSGGAISRLSANIADLTRELQRQSRNSDAKDKGDKLKELQSAIDEAKKQRNEGLKTMLKGSLETVGAAHGAVAGAVIGMGRGENTLDTALKGAGVGDIIGEAVSNAITSTPKTVKDTKAGLKAEIRAHISEPSKSAYKKLEEELKRENKKNFEELDRKLYEYTKQANMNSKNIKVKTSKSAPKSKNSKFDASNME